MDRESLEGLVADGATMREMADALEVSPSTIQYWLKKLGLRTKNGVGRRPGVEGQTLPVTTATCPRHGETQYVSKGMGATDASAAAQKPSHAVAAGSKSCS